MPINAVEGSTNYDTEMLVKAKEQQKTEGRANVKLIEEAAVRSPETERARNPNSTLSVIA